MTRLVLTWLRVFNHIDQDRVRRLGLKVKFIRLVLPMALAFAASTIADAQTAMPTWGKITFMGGGWVGADLRVQLNTTFYNPGACTATDGYIVANTTAGAQLFESMLITAYAHGDSVNLVVNGCYESRPNIIGVNIQPTAS